MQKAIKVNVFGNFIEEGFILHGLFINSNKEPKIIFPINENNGIFAMDNEQNLYITCSSYN